MKLYWILFAGILFIGVYVPCNGFLNAERFQEFVDKYVDKEKFKEQGLASLNSTAWDHIWNYFKKVFHRHYSSSGEEIEHLRVFRQHLKRVIQSNLNKKSSIHFALNEYADMTLQEFNSVKKGFKLSNRIQQKYNDQTNQEILQRSLSKLYQNPNELTRLKRNLHRRRHEKQHISAGRFQKFIDRNLDENNDKLTKEFDWRTKNVVTSIKNQGDCGSCYAFATTAVLESAYAIKEGSKNLIDFSPQQIVDCSIEYKNGGCDGGDFERSINFIQAHGGKIATYDSYFYNETEESCRIDNINEIDLGNIEWGESIDTNETKLAETLVNYGPLFVAIDTDSWKFMFYDSGIFEASDCINDLEGTDHVVAAVGYGYDEVAQKPYWIIKNSWGTDWGIEGYLHLAKDQGNMCGIGTYSSYAKLT